MASSKVRKVIEKYSPCGGFFSKKIMKFSWNSARNFVQLLRHAKKRSPLDEKFGLFNLRLSCGGVKFLWKVPCGALFLPTCTTPPPVTIFSRRGLDRNFGQLKNFREKGYWKVHIFDKKKKSTLYHRGWYRGREMGVSWGRVGLISTFGRFRPFLGRNFSWNFTEIFGDFSWKSWRKSGEKVGKKWGEKWGKIRAKDDPKSDPKSGVLFHDKIALENGYFLGVKF